MDSQSAAQLAALFGLEGKTAIITGSGGGLGREMARTFAMAGAQIVVADVKPDLTQSAVDELNGNSNRGAIALGIPTDVSDEASVVKLFETSVKEFGGVDVLVNCAGRIGSAPFADLTVEEYESFHAVNSRGVFLCMREAIKHMRAAGKGGSIINISSVSSLRAATLEGSGYGASKASVNALTTSVALDVGADQIRVNAILPGGFPVERNQKSIAARKTPLKGPITDVTRVPIGRYGKASELASVALFLASPASFYITGHLLPVDGGFLIS